MDVTVGEIPRPETCIRVFTVSIATTCTCKLVVGRINNSQKIITILIGEGKNKSDGKDQH